MKALGHVVSDKKIFENCILKTYFLTLDLLMQPTGTVWTTLIGSHPGIILWSLVKIQKAVSEDMLFKEIVDRRTDGRQTLKQGKGLW